MERCRVERVKGQRMQMPHTNEGHEMQDGQVSVHAVKNPV